MGVGHMAEEEQDRRSHPPVGRTTTSMAVVGISGEDFYPPPPPQPNLLSETGIINPVHVVEWIHPNETRVGFVGNSSKGQHRYPGDKYVGDHV